MSNFQLRALLVATVCCVSASSASAQSVQGGTYEDNGGVVKIEFQAGGKAFTAMGPMSTPCTYTQTGKAIAMTCEGEKLDVTVNDDGSLSGPPGGLVSRMTKKKM